MNEELFTGALEDTRTQEAKNRDYLAEEVASFSPPDWKEIDLNKTYYPIRNQDGSGSCVAQSLALILGIENLREEGKFLELSASDIYNRRTNESLGMLGVEAMDIGMKTGATLETLMPSQNMNEATISSIQRLPSYEQIGMIFKSGGYLQLPFDIDKIASIMEQFKVNGICKPIMTWYHFPFSEWLSMPQLSNNDQNMVRHSVVAIDYGLVEGKKALVTQDSWGLDKTTNKGLRYITGDYLKARMIFCAYVYDLSNTWRDKPEESKPNKPKYIIGDISSLQNCLKWLGYFPLNVESTGIFGAITRKAVIQFQKNYGLNPPLGNVGPLTTQKLLELFS